MAAIAQVIQPGLHLVWLDTVWPMHRKAEWRTVGRITLLRSTNHRLREVSIFERRGRVDFVGRGTGTSGINGNIGSPAITL
jgi:hypothetical protein